jgi:hypothetical protein
MKKSAIPFLLVFTLFGCKDEDEPFSFGDKGVVHGIVYLSGVQQDLSGSEVHLIGHDYHQTFTTGSDGGFRFESVPTSNYHVEIFHEGFGELKIFNIDQSGLDTMLVYMNGTFAPTLYKKTDFQPPEIASLTAAYLSNGALNIDVLLHSTVTGRVRVFLGTTPDVSPDNYLFTEAGWFYPEWMEVWPYSYVDFDKFYPGVDQLYAVVYPDGGGAYFDPEKGKYVFSALNIDRPSEKKSLQLP